MLKSQTKNSVAIELLQTLVPYTMQPGVLVDLSNIEGSQDLNGKGNLFLRVQGGRGDARNG
jgi:hypothetical protein